MNPLPLLRTVNPSSIAGKRVLLRVDLNVPVEGGVVRDDFRMRKIVPTIDLLQKMRARVVLISHAEGKGGPTSLEPMFHYLQRFFPLSFFAGAPRDAQEKVFALADGEVLLLENLRFGDGEELNSAAFSRALAVLADMYVNEAFSVSHRAHASVVGVPRLLPHFAGLLFEQEVAHLSRAFTAPRPLVLILGGLKFATKVPLVRKFLTRADTIFVYGALANAFLKAKGIDIKDSACDTLTPDALGLMEEKKIIFPRDVVWNGNVISDIGDESMKDVEKALLSAAFVVWNGPLGKFEEGFGRATERLAGILAASEVESIVGGGDTVAALHKFGLLDKFGFVSTGGGAMLDFLANETLPGIEALKSAKQ